MEIKIILIKSIIKSAVIITQEVRLVDKMIVLMFKIYDQYIGKLKKIFQHRQSKKLLYPWGGMEINLNIEIRAF